MKGKTGQRISQQQLESYLWGAATLLRGTIDAGDYKQFIFPLLFYKRLCDVFDEERDTAVAELGKDFPENHRFQIPSDAHWNKVREVTTSVGTVLQNAMRSIEKANQDKLYGIFGDAQWTNKDRLSDAMLRDLIEHFSSLDLTIANLPEDELGNGYEYLIKKFADDSGHTAAEFYTNRTVVHLMTELLQPQPGETIYDPTCGSGGMLLSAIAHLKNQGKEWRNVKLSGQELNLMTSSIARMNCFLHGVEDFRIERGNTLSDPKFIENGELQKFDILLANPPYSIKQWDRAAFENDSWGRNMWGTPPQGRADFAFQQHIIKSLNKSGRAAVLWPHGILFRKEEEHMRRRMLEEDAIECIIGLGPNLFYNSPMESCIVICRKEKTPERNRKILFIDAVREVARVQGSSSLGEEHIHRIVAAYHRFTDEPGFAAVKSTADLLSAGATLAIAANVRPDKPSRPDPAAISDLIDAAVSSMQVLQQALEPVGLAPTSHIPAHGGIPSPAATWIVNAESWPEVELGKFARIVTENTRDPSAAGITKAIGLDDLVPGDLKIRNWKHPSETTFTRICRPGQVLFGRRRAYQRKIAVAHATAVVSGDIIVIDTSTPELSRAILPYICGSERFFQRAIRTSAGSLSPRTNWAKLATHKFKLPPAEWQSRIGFLFQTIAALRAQCATTAVNAQAACEAVLREMTNPFPRRPLSDCLIETPRNGLYVPASKYGSGTPIVRIETISAGEFKDISSLKEVDIDIGTRETFGLRPGDLLIHRVNSLPWVGKLALVPEGLSGAVFESNIMRLRLREAELDPRFLIEWSRLAEYRGQVRARAKPAVNQASINRGDVESLQVPRISTKEQESILHQVRNYRDVETAALVAAERWQDVLNSMSEVF